MQRLEKHSLLLQKKKKKKLRPTQLQVAAAGIMLRLPVMSYGDLIRTRTQRIT